VGTFDALLGRILSNGAEVELGNGLDFKRPMSAELNASTGVIEITTVDEVDVTAAPYNATGDGTTDDTAAIALAEAAAGASGNVTFPSGTYLISTAYNQSARWVIKRGATIKLEAPLTLDVGVDAAPDQAMFDESSARVTFSAVQRVYANWWTVSGDDIAARWNRCVRACRGNGPTEIALVGTHTTAGQFDLTGWGSVAVAFDLSGARLTTSSENPFRLRGSTNARLLLGATDHNDGVT